MICEQHRSSWNGATGGRSRLCAKLIMPMPRYRAFCLGRLAAGKSRPIPASGGKLYAGTRVDKIWSDADVDRFLRTAPAYLQLAMLLAINTGQRQGDLLRLPWSAYDGTSIKMKQRKTGAFRSWFPMH